IDWFHITMRITVLLQQLKGLEAEQPEYGHEVARELTSIKHFLWHGNTFQALQRLKAIHLDI
ncbi:MAG: ISKra4 family transposase, partial [Blastocatellia bacterium]